MDHQFSDGLLERISRVAAAAEAEGFEAGSLGALFLRLRLRAPAAGGPDTGLPEIDALYRDRREAFARILQHLAGQYGCGDIEASSDQRLAALASEASDLVDRWDEDEPVEGWKPETELQRLLAAHHEVGEAILWAAEDMERDLRPRRRRRP